MGHNSDVTFFITLWKELKQTHQAKKSNPKGRNQVSAGQYGK